MKKYFSIIISSLLLLCLILSCSHYEGPGETGQLAIILHFPDEGDNVSDNPGKADESRTVESIDQVYCSIDKDGSEVYGEWLTLNGGQFTSEEIWLEAGSGYTVFVECFISGIRSHEGFDGDVTIQADEINVVDMTLNVTIPQIPLNLHAEAVAADEVKLVWIDIAVNEDGYKIERKTTGVYTEIGTVGEDVTEYYDSGLIQGTTYTYRIKAYNAAGVSAWSNTSYAVPGFDIPTPPGNLQADAISATEIELTWDDNSNNELGFRLERSIGNTSSFIFLADVNANIEDYSDSGLTPSTNYFYRVAAYNNSGVSIWSNVDDAMTTALQAGDEQEFPLGNTGLNITMVWIPSGSFMQGAYSSELGAQSNEYPQHLVTLDYGFWMGKYEVTQEQWQSVTGYNNSCFSGADRPVEMVSWDDIDTGFLPILNLQTATGEWRLPSESEWEYACRAGTTTRYYWGDDLSGTMIDDYAVYYLNDPGGTAEVGTKLPNAWNLYDISGNIWEWCEDYWHTDYNGAPINGDPWLSPTNSSRLQRGGSWSNPKENCRSADRFLDLPSHSLSHFGFRLVLSP